MCHRFLSTRKSAVKRKKKSTVGQKVRKRNKRPPTARIEIRAEVLIEENILD